MQHSKTSESPLQSWLTVERALYGLILLIAIGTRFFLLAEQPLNPLEANQTWAAWVAVQPGQAATMAAAPDSPLLHVLYRIAFLLFGGSDALVRAIPAIFGVATVALLWFWRAWLGRATVLVAAALIAIDPWSTLYSRLADSNALSTFFGLLTLTALVQLVTSPPQRSASRTATDATTADTMAMDAPPTDALSESTATAESAVTAANETAEKPVPAAPNTLTRTADAPLAPTTDWMQIFAVGLGLLLVSGPQMWNWLVVLALFIVIVLPNASWQAMIERRTLWLLTVVVAISGATGWLFYPQGIGAVSTSLTSWIAQWNGSSATTGYPLSWLWLRIITDSPLLLCFGLLGLLWGWMHREQQALQRLRFAFLSGWLAWGVILVLVPGRGPLTLTMLGLPLLLLAADAITHSLVNAHQDLQWRESGILLLVLAALFVTFAFWLATFTSNAVFDSTIARTLFFILVLVLLLLAAYALWLNGRQALLVIGGSVAIILLLWTLNSAWALNHHFDLRHPDGFFRTYTNPDARELADAVQMISAQRNGDPGELQLQVEMMEMPDPVLGWYLRDMRNLEWVLAPGAAMGTAPNVLITHSASANVGGLTAAYMGSSYALRDEWLPTRLTDVEVVATPAAEAGFFDRLQARINAAWSARTRNLLRWIIYHRVDTLPPSEQVTLWVATGSAANQQTP